MTKSRSVGSLILLHVLGAALLIAIAAPVGAYVKDSGPPWKFDVLHLKNRRTIVGLIIDESKSAVRFKRVLGTLDERVRVYVQSFEREEIQRIDRLGAADRRELEERLRELEPRAESEMLGKIALKPAVWPLTNVPAVRFSSPRFELVSTASELNVRRTILHLERILDVCERLLPRRQNPPRPTVIWLAKSRAEYAEMLHRQHKSFQNPAYYDAAANRIVCVCDLETLYDELNRVHREIRQQLNRLDTSERDLRRVFKTNPPRDRLAEIEKARSALEDLRRKSDDRLARGLQRWWATLNHETFHAYLANFVYPPATAEVPRWLNEGLAQIFEAASLHGDTLVVDRLDRERCKAVQDAERGGQLPRVADLLRSNASKFLVAHADDRRVADKYYLASWALAVYLTFDRKILGRPEMDAYVHALKKPGANQLEAFTTLVGQPLLEFEARFREYVRLLKSSGLEVSLPVRP